jgi:hypothetical protein
LSSSGSLVALLKWSNLQFSIVGLGALCLKENLSLRRVQIRGFVHKFAVHKILDVVTVNYQFKKIPLPVWLLYFASGITIAGDILPGSFAETRRLHVLIGTHFLLACDQLTLDLEASAFDQPDVTSTTLNNLELEGTGPKTFQWSKQRACYVVQDSAVPGLPHTVQIGFVAPLEFGAQVVILIFLLGHDAAKIIPGYVNHPLLHLEDLIGVVIQSFRFEQDIETVFPWGGIPFAVWAIPEVPTAAEAINKQRNRFRLGGIRADFPVSIVTYAWAELGAGC